jgi:hypothetical protein
MSLRLIQGPLATRAADLHPRFLPVFKQWLRSKFAAMPSSLPETVIPRARRSKRHDDLCRERKRASSSDVAAAHANVTLTTIPSSAAGRLRRSDDRKFFCHYTQCIGATKMTARNHLGQLPRTTVMPFVAVLTGIACGGMDLMSDVAADDAPIPTVGQSFPSESDTALKQASVAGILAAPAGALMDPLTAPALARVRDDASSGTETTDKSWAPVAEDVWCWEGSHDWLCSGDDGCFFMFSYVSAPGDYAYCDGYWPDYWCVCRSSYYACQ